MREESEKEGEASNTDIQGLRSDIPCRQYQFPLLCALALLGRRVSSGGIALDERKKGFLYWLQQGPRFLMRKMRKVF